MCIGIDVGGIYIDVVLLDVLMVLLLNKILIIVDVMLGIVNVIKKLFEDSGLEDSYGIDVVMIGIM